MLLFLVKHSRPDANATRELSKANDGANSVAFKELLHVIEFILNLKNFGLKLEPTGCLSCEVKFSKDKKRAWLGQPHLIKSLVKQFGENGKNI